MLTVFDGVGGKLVKRDADKVCERGDSEPVWIDLINPTKEEDRLVETLTGVKIPTREEMEEIEASSRIYQEGGAHYMTAIVLHQEDMALSPTVTSPRLPATVDAMPPVPIATAVTFVLVRQTLVTVRYAEPRAFPLFLQRNQKGDNPVGGGCSAMVSLIEAVIDREADRVERVQADVDKIGHRIFEIRGGQAAINRRFDLAVKQIGREGEMTSRSRESLQSLDRVLTYLTFAMGERNDEKGLRARVKTAGRDVEGLNDQISYLSSKVSFLLDATLGMIGLQQTNIIKFFTVVSVALMPPTLIASIYGMNFKGMPELEWSLGYPMAIVLMIISAILPFMYFKRRGWL